MNRGKEYIKKMQQYIADVLSGERNAGVLEKLAIQRHLDDFGRTRNLLGRESGYEGVIFLHLVAALSRRMGG